MLPMLPGSRVGRSGVTGICTHRHWCAICDSADCGIVLKPSGQSFESSVYFSESECNGAKHFCLQTVTLRVHNFVNIRLIDLILIYLGRYML
jgi:hypothetical protein